MAALVTLILLSQEITPQPWDQLNYPTLVTEKDGYYHSIGVVSSVSRVDNNVWYLAGQKIVLVRYLTAEESALRSAAVAVAHNLWEYFTPDQPVDELREELFASAKNELENTGVLDACQNLRAKHGYESSHEITSCVFLAFFALEVFQKRFTIKRRLPLMSVSGVLIERDCYEVDG